MNTGIVCALVVIGVLFLLARAAWNYYTSELFPFEVEWNLRLQRHQGDQACQNHWRSTVSYKYKRWPELLRLEDLATEANDRVTWEVHGDQVVTSREYETLESTIRRAGGDPKCIFRIDTTPYQLRTRFRRGSKRSRLRWIGGREKTFFRAGVRRFSFDEKQLREWLVSAGNSKEIVA